MPPQLDMSSAPAIAIARALGVPYGSSTYWWAPTGAALLLAVVADACADPLLLAVALVLFAVLLGIALAATERDEARLAASMRREIDRIERRSVAVSGYASWLASRQPRIDLVTAAPCDPDAIAPLVRRCSSRIAIQAVSATRVRLELPWRVVPVRADRPDRRERFDRFERRPDRALLDLVFARVIEPLDATTGVRVEMGGLR